MGGIPEFLTEKLKKQYGEEGYSRILAGYEAKRPVTCRINPLRTDRETADQAFRDAGISYLPVPWYEDARIIQNAREKQLQEMELYQSGGIYLQSLSSMLPPLILGPAAGEAVLDMAAAPGGKTTQMAALTGGRAQITACEKNKVRAERLGFNLNRQGAAGVYVMVEDARRLDDLFSFDRILLDAPCSGSGTLRLLNGECRTEFSKELLVRSVRTQEQLLKKAMKLLKPGHEMVYSTCSILKEENEELLFRVLPGCGGQVVPVEEEWAEKLPLLPSQIPGTLVVAPDELFEGFFVARIRKKAG